MAMPVPKHKELLIKVHATTANRTDYHVLTGRPFMMRLFTGLFKPKRSIIGSDFAGQVEAIGEDVKSFNAGDKVMGFASIFGGGSHAQYFTIRETRGVVMMPGNSSYEQAATCCEGTFYAASVLLHLKPRPAKKALVYGATGAIGSAYLQVLKYYGVYVTAVCGGENADLVRSLGADKVIDYKTQDFTKDTERYDYVFDAVGKSSFMKCKRLLNKKGIYFPSDGAENIFLVPLTKLLGGKKVAFTGARNINGTLNFIKDLVEKGSFRPLIDRTYPLDNIAEAFDYVATGQKIGNVVVTMEG